MSDPVLCERDGATFIISLNRPERSNAMNHEMRTELLAAFQQFDQDDSLSVAILTAVGDRAFCAGADLHELSDMGLQSPPRDFIPHLQRTVFVSKPIIAAVNGAAMGGGWLLAQMCDLCIAVEGALFGITEARWGRGAPWAAPLIWMIPQRVMMEVLLTAEPINAERAYEVGLVNRVVPRSELLPSALEMAQAIGERAPLTLKAHKRLVYQATEMGRSAALNVADEYFERVYESHDAQEGPRAFKEDRAPEWKGF